MKIKMNLQSTPEEFYQVIMDSLKYGLKEHANQKEDDLYEGLEYKKKLATKLGTETSTKFKILELVPNEIYKSKVTHNTDEIFITYKLEPNEMESILLYEEEYNSEKKRKSINHSIVGTIMSPFLKRAKKKQFKAMDKYIIENRKN